MGRRKIEIQKIQNVKSRQVTFSKRRAGLFKKANDLSVLCGAEVGVIVFSITGKLFQFSSSRMEQIISKYHRSLDSLEEEPSENEDEPEIGALKEHIEKLQLGGRQMSGEDIDVLSMEELQELELQISKGIKSVKERKEQLLYEQLQKSQEKEQKVVKENEVLQKQIEELQQRTAITEIPRKKKRSAASCPKTPTNEDENSTMHLGLLADVCCKNEDEV